MWKWLALGLLGLSCGGTSTSHYAEPSAGRADNLDDGGSSGESAAGAAAGFAGSSGGSSGSGESGAGASAGFAGSSGGSSSSGTPGELRDYLGDPAYPDSFWQPASFESSGIDGALIEAAFDRIRTNGWEVHSFLLARRGRLVVERYGWNQGTNVYFPGTPHQVIPSETHAVFSTTKSFLSALYGIALAEGRISNLDQTAASYFPDYAELEPSTDKSSITLEDLLTMRSGLDLSEPDMTTDAPDPARAALSRPVVDLPVGEVWNYSSANSEILAAILRTATGRTPLDYANEKLFTPIGLQNPRWDAAETGTQHGGFGLWLTSRDLARFGELYRNSGTWAGRSVVPAEWTDTSTAPRCATEWGGQYAYHFWVPDYPGLSGFFNTLGAFGQVVYVSRALELVVVFTAELPNETANLDYEGLISDFIVPALR